VKSIHSLVPNADDLLALEPEELGGVLLEHLNSLEPQDSGFHRGNFSGSDRRISEYPDGKREPIMSALIEAWAWLEREGLIVPKPGSNGQHGWISISRRGRQLQNRADVDAYRRADRFPRAMLHPAIGSKVFPAYLRGDYDTAVFMAFKEVEVAVRHGGGLNSDDYGVDLMRRAFHKEHGPLRDKQAPVAERDACANLFAGAIGMCKNPTSHRNVDVEADAAAELVVLASHLLRIVDTRVAASAATV